VSRQRTSEGNILAVHLSLCDSAPDKSGNGNNGGYYEQPPNQPEDADKHERSHDDAKKNSN